MSARPPLLVIVGPTAVGKTAYCVLLGQALRAEIVTADSMQVYRGMDIGTAKPPPEERGGVPHHCLDLVDPRDAFNVADYRRHALAAIADIHRRGRLPILTGGTGLYVRAVVDDFLFPDRGADWELRRRLEEEAARLGRAALHARLAQVDPETAARLHPNDLRRVVRALEVYQRTGRPLSQHLREARARQPRFDLLMFGLTRPREELYARINRRVEEQIAAGLVEEVRRLMAQGLDEGHVAMQGLGYKEIIGYLKGRWSLQEAIRILQRDTRHYARRQLIWFKADPRIQWLDLSQYPSLQAATAPVVAAVRARWPQYVQDDPS
ncbi:MAG: tRNA (adenosine(37)-N6)-dimethylallyltransferase MiaA [Limnochordales bacterium]|nr:tRNA (adenosine(37)-N6)-dimethylallyltransferase MiaA [Limnochordales bacterium]